MAVPDFAALAQQQAQLANNASAQTTQANRANQYNPYGSLTWGLGPDGTWTQNVSLNPEYQNLNNSITQGQTNLAGRIGQGVSTDGLQDWGSTDIWRGVSDMPDGSFGASQQVIDAMRNLQQPGLDRNRDAERARLAAMGITLGSDASNSSERNLGNAASDAEMKAILAGTQEYGNVFNRQLAQRQQGVDENIKASNLATALRGSQFNERIGQNTSDIAGMTALGGQRIDPKFASYAPATPTVAPNVYGAAADSWSAANNLWDRQISQANAGAASSANRQQGLLGLAGAGIQAAGGLGNIWDTVGDWFGGGASDPLGDFGSANGWW